MLTGRIGVAPFKSASTRLRPRRHWPSPTEKWLRRRANRTENCLALLVRRNHRLHDVQTVRHPPIFLAAGGATLFRTLDIMVVDTFEDAFHLTAPRTGMSSQLSPLMVR